MMSDSISAQEPNFQLPWGRAVEHEPGGQRLHDTLTAELQAAFAREQVLSDEKHDLSERHLMLAQEFEHRVLNGLQLIAGVLTSQSRAAAKTPEAAIQLTSAARRVVALGTTCIISYIFAIM